MDYWDAIREVGFALPGKRIQTAFGLYKDIRHELFGELFVVDSPWSAE
jgi:hypothetical protein